MYENNHLVKANLKYNLRMKFYAIKFDYFYFINVAIMAGW